MCPSFYIQFIIQLWRVHVMLKIREWPLILEGCWKNSYVQKNIKQPLPLEYIKKYQPHPEVHILDTHNQLFLIKTAFLLHLFASEALKRSPPPHFRVQTKILLPQHSPPPPPVLNGCPLLCLGCLTCSSIQFHRCVLFSISWGRFCMHWCHLSFALISVTVLCLK